MEKSLYEDQIVLMLKQLEEQNNLIMSTNELLKVRIQRIEAYLSRLETKMVSPYAMQPESTGEEESRKEILI